MTTIFISFTSVDKPWADWIGWVLEHEGGHIVRKHDWEIEAGVIMRWMEEAHDASSCLLSVTSPTYLTKPYSTMERHAAMHADPCGKSGFFRIALIEPTKLSNLMAIFKRIELFGKDVDAAKLELLGYFTPLERPKSEPAFPGTVLSSVTGAIPPPPPFPLTLPSIPATPAPAIRSTVFDIDHLPDISYVELRGREKELDCLEIAWASEGVNVLSLVAWGGAGKTAVVTEWLRKRRDIGDAEVVLGWSFYSQGSHQRTTSAEGFLVWAAEKLGCDTTKMPNELAEAIAVELGRRRILLVLDGVEPLQEGLGSKVGDLRDMALRELLRRAAGLPKRPNAGLVLVTTRASLTDLAIARFKDTVLELPLDSLSDVAGAALLTDRGVKGREADLEAAAHDFGGHALALTLLAGFLVRRHDGEVARRDRIRKLVSEPRTVEERVHGHAKRVMESLEQEWLAEAPVALAILYAVGLFDRPASADCLAALREPNVSSCLAAYAGADDNEIADMIFDLRKVGLLAEPDPAAPGSLDAHPLVREWFGERFRQIDETGWSAAHGRIFDHLCNTTQESREPTLTELQPLFQAIPHGCHAGRHEEALQKVLLARIYKNTTDNRTHFFARTALGATSTNLASLACFFERPFNHPSSALLKNRQSWVLREAAYSLGLLGRYREAITGLRDAVSAAVAGSLWDDAAVSTCNLLEAEMIIGELAAAKADAVRAIMYAATGTRLTQRMISKGHAARVAMMLGEPDEARKLLTEAGALQRERQPKFPELDSVGGWYLADFRLDGSKDFLALADRAEETLALSKSSRILKDIGLDHSTLARAILGILLVRHSKAALRPGSGGNFMLALEHAADAITNLQRANDLKFLPHGHFARARIARACGDWVIATSELNEIEDFALPSGMRPTLCDVALERCRYALARRFHHAPLADLVSTPFTPAPAIPDEDLIFAARASLDEAKQIVDECGYHRRDTEIVELELVLADRRSFASLPPYV